MRRVDLLAGGVYVLAAILVAGFASSFWLFLLTSAAITALVAVSVGVIYDNAGLLSLCQMSFAGIGAWTVGWLTLKTELPYLAMLPLAALAAMIVGVAIGIPALRLRGQNLAVFTLIFSAAVSRVVLSNGFPGLIEGNRVVLPSYIAGDVRFFLLCVGLLGAVAAGVTALRRARLGRWWFSVRRSERATASMGRSIEITKLSAFGVSAAIAGLAGGLLVALNGTVSGASFVPLESMTIMTSALMFGAGNFEGALLAGLFARLIPNLLSDLGIPQDVAPMIFAVGGVISLSKGEGGMSAAIRAFIRKRKKPMPEIERSNTVVEALPRAGNLNDGAPVLTLRDVSVSYGAIKALNSVSFNVASGSMVGLIGPNGAGKSTLVDVLSGFISSHEGQIELEGKVLNGLAPGKRAKLGLRRSFQQGHTPQDLTLGGYLDLIEHPNISTDDALSFFSLPDKSVLIGELDVGTRRILEVCGTVIGQPKVVLLDEPAAGLSGHDRENFIAALADVPKIFGVTVVLIEHDLEVVSSLCDQIVVLDFGTVIASGNPATVLENPEVVAAYLGASAA